MKQKYSHSIYIEILIKFMQLYFVKFTIIPAFNNSRKATIYNIIVKISILKGVFAKREMVTQQ